MTLFVGATGKRFVLGRLLGKGGEWQVFEIYGEPNLALKIYNPAKASLRKAKVEAMVEAGLHQQSSYVAFPIDVVRDHGGAFMGFTMKKVPDTGPFTIFTVLAVAVSSSLTPMSGSSSGLH